MGKECVMTEFPSPLSAVKLIELIRQGRIDIKQYHVDCITMLSTKEQLNCFINHDAKQWLSACQHSDTDSVLAGLPFIIKDNIDVKGFVTTAGCPALASAPAAIAHAPVVQALINAGAVIAGKANMHELAQGVTSNNKCYGPVRNPYNDNMIAGGSSGGTAAAIAAGIVPMGLGSDTGGSCRIPAALCNVVGFRPSIGRYSSQGVVPMSTTRDTVGPMARYVEDVALLDEVITGDSELDMISLEGLRIGVPMRSFYQNLEPEVTRITEQALALLKHHGAILIEADIANLETLDKIASFPIVLYESIADMSVYLEQIGLSWAQFMAGIHSPDVQQIYASLLNGDAITKDVYQQALMTFRPQLQQVYADYFNDHQLHCMVYPTTPLLAKEIGQDCHVQFNGRTIQTLRAYVRNTTPSTTADIPSLSVPAGFSHSGMPSGICFDGPNGSDRKLLAIGMAFQKAQQGIS